MTAPDTDVIVIGAGPAGIAAALEAARQGRRVVLLDENPAAGGRIWQALEARGAADADEETAIDMIRALADGAVDCHYNAGVWGIEPDGTAHWTESGVSRSARAPRIVLATGTTERPMPVRGWTLPGVMTVGAAQIALKTAGLLPDENTWIAGQGPLIYLYGVQAIRAGGRLAGILNMEAPAARLRALRFVPGALRDIRKGYGWIREIERAGIPILRARDVRAEGRETLDRVGFTAKGVQRNEKADLLLLHDGVIPSVQLTRALGCAHVWDNNHRCWRPVVNELGETSVKGISVAGDGAGVGGAAAAVLSGRIAAGADDRTALRTLLRRRRLIDTMFAPRRPDPEDATIICRCEEVNAGQIRGAAREGCLGLSQLKAFTRCGMGPCQGRMCGTTAGEVLAHALGRHAGDIEPFRARFPARPLTVGELAGLHQGEHP